MTIITDTSPVPSALVSRIRGTLGEKVLRKSPELFNQGLPTVLAEVLQNSRRAGATRVEIQHIGDEGRATLVVRDDGHGIADMAKLVTFGSSDWDERTDLVENAAGMGVFSLAARGVTVRSRGRRVTLSREVFCGEAEAAVLPDPEMAVGTELLFPVAERAVEHAIRKACRFYPVPVTLNGKPLAQPGFLDGAEHVVEWQGLRLGVFRHAGPQLLDLFDRHRGWDRRLYLNFHGHVVECRGPVTLTEVNGPTRSVFVDVVSAPDLRLVLPARDQAIENDFLRAMRARSELALLEAVALGPKHSLGFEDARRAERLGLVLPPVEIGLKAWGLAGDGARYHGEDASEVVVLGTAGPEVLRLGDFGLGDPCGQANLHRLLLDWPERPRMVRDNDRFAGYPAYDALCVVQGLSATATSADGVTEEVLPSTAKNEQSPFVEERHVVEALSVRLLVKEDPRSWKSPVVWHEAAIPFIFTSEPCGDEFPDLFVVRGTDPGDLADALVEGFFSQSDDAHADSFERQHDEFSADARDFARKLLLDTEAAVAAKIVEELRGIRWVLRTLGTGHIELRIAPAQDGSTIRIVTADGKEVTAVL